jgi:hypothetical protein
MPTIEETKQSINQFSHYLSELNDEGFVSLDNEKQVKFFLDFLSLFKIDQSQITIYVYQCIEIDVGDYDYETGHHTYQVCGSHEGYLIVLGDHDQGLIADRSGIANADDFQMEDDTDTFITNGGE